MLLYPKISKQVKWDKSKIKQYTLMLNFFTDFLPEKQINSEEIAKHDPKDFVILNTFISSQSGYLVTGDKDLFELSQTYSFITLNDFYNVLRTNTAL